MIGNFFRFLDYLAPQHVARRASMDDRFVALVCVVLGVWRRSWALSLRPCEAACDGMLIVAHDGRADDRGRAARDRS